MKTFTNAVTFRANESTGAVAVEWRSEVYSVGGNVRVTLWRNGHAFGEDLAPSDVKACLRNCARAGKAMSRTYDRLMQGAIELVLAA